MKRAALVIIVTISAFCVLFGQASAGTGYRIKCENKSCIYSSNVNFGGGMGFNQITGYCVHCKGFVYLTWYREGWKWKKGNTPDKAPMPLGKVWCPNTGQVKNLYKCPHCGKPFMEIYSIEELKYCPRCSKETIKYKEGILYD
ncbi:MAG: hypothetical protein M1269_04410 [Chloroflexi bacterium]|nr:hypothetical protein [Chloroflexota bacterium]